MQKTSKIQCVATPGSNTSKGGKLMLVVSENCIEDMYKTLDMTCCYYTYFNCMNKPSSHYYAWRQIEY